MTRTRLAIKKQIAVAEKHTADCFKHEAVATAKGEPLTDTQRWQEHLERLVRSLVDHDERVKK